MRNPASTVKSDPHPPARFEWSVEKLQALSQEQLLNLLENLDHQRGVGRIPEDAAAELELRITRLLTSQNSTKRRKQVARLAVIDDLFQAGKRDPP
jgi:hypothetical protein